VIEAGERRDPSFLPDIEARLKDPQMNVRTKACRALGRMGSDRAISLLDKTVRNDPSWYVRDYAYAALGRIRPEARVVRITGVK
jgi:HEAT repeat protein